MKTIRPLSLILAGEAVLLIGIALTMALLTGAMFFNAQAAPPATQPKASAQSAQAAYDPVLVGALTSQIPLIPESFTVNLPGIMK
jgi:hypothetical protein